MPRDLRALRAGIDARLLDRAAEVGQDVSRLRRQLAFQRVLARLALDDQWVLKGGFALEVRLVDVARATRDLDLAALVDVSAGDVQDVLDQALDHEVDDDGFTFTVSAARRVAPEQAGVAAWGLSVTAHLGGRPFQTMHVDVSARPDEVADGVERLIVPSRLDGLGLSPVDVLAVDVAQHAAEKFHALTRRYAGDRPSTRVKDLVDLVLLAEAGLLPDGRLGARLRHVHGVRDGIAPPGTVPDPPEAWRASTPGWPTPSGSPPPTSTGRWPWSAPSTPRGPSDDPAPLPHGHRDDPAGAARRRRQDLPGHHARTPGSTATSTASRSSPGCCSSRPSTTWRRAGWSATARTGR